MKHRKLLAGLTALATAAVSLSAMTGISAFAADGAGGYAWVSTNDGTKDAYQKATTSVEDSNGTTTANFADCTDGSDGEIAGFCAMDGTGWDWSDYTKLSFKVTNNCDSDINFGIALGTGANWAWYQSTVGATVEAKQSTVLTYYLKSEEWALNGGEKVSELVDSYMVHRINLMVSAPYQSAPITGSVTISDLELGGSAAESVEPKDGFYVDGTVLRDANQNPFIMRGTSYEYTWFTWQGNADKALAEMAGYGANAVRIVLSNGTHQDWTKNSAGEIQNLIKLCEENKLVAVLEVHDATGDDNISGIQAAADYFVEMKSALVGHEDTVIINIANEWMTSTSDSLWQQGWKQAVKTVRDAGLTHCIMCDAGGYGQAASTVINGGAAVLEADPEHNCMFSVHMYSQAGKDANTIKSTIDAMQVRNLCFVVGEFAQKDDWGDVDEAYIMSYCEETNTGWLAWSWYGNNSAYMDMSSANAGGTLSADWGELIVNGANGWKETAKVATVFSDEPIVTTTTTPAPETTTAPAETTTVSEETTTVPVVETTAELVETTTEPAATETTPAVSGKLGDVDESGEVDVSDAVLLARYCVEDKEAIISDQGLVLADVNKDGKPTNDDVTLIVKFVANLITAF